MAGAVAHFQRAMMMDSVFIAPIVPGRTRSSPRFWLRIMLRAGLRQSLVEKAGYKMSDIPNTWDAFVDFFLPMQAKLRSQGMRHVYALGLEVSKACDAAEHRPCVFAHELPPSALGKRCAMTPRKRALAMLRQPFVPIKTKRVWFNETGAGVVHARLGRGATEGGRAFPPFFGFLPLLGQGRCFC